MGIYLNPGNEQFAVSINSELYVDKTELIKYTNSRIGKDRPLICSSRPRRFGKTMAVTMLAAYYSKGCHSEKLFAKFKISQNEFFKRHLNKYNVLLLDIQWMYGNALEEMKRNPSVKIVSYIQEQVIGELKKEYPECVQDTDISLPSVLANINAVTKEQFIIIIDEWDCLFREDKNNEKLQKEYINLLRGLFKGAPSGAFLKLAYITGILSIKKYGTQSALNNFREHTMVSPRQMAEYVGFTEIEVKTLCKEHNMSFKEMQRWYDGYFFETIGHVYSPNSVVEAIDSGEFGNYWSRTETYESLMMYIAMDFDGLRQLIVDMLGGQRCNIDVESFQNDITSFNSADDVITLLIHMGYLAYDNKAKEAFIPNEEVRSVFLRAIKNDGWDEVVKAVNASEELLRAKRRSRFMKRMIALIVMVSLLALLTSCGDSGNAPEVSEQSGNTQQSGSTQQDEEISSVSDEPVLNEADAGKEQAADIKPDVNGEASTVYFTSDISPEGMVAVYEALGWNPAGKVAVKLSTGEPPASNYLRPELIKDLVELVDGTIVECNTAYGGSRAETAMHYQVAKDHGFTDIADFQILDENGSMSLPVESGSQLSENLVGAAFGDYDSYLVLSHFKGHAMAGFGGAIKNISIGLGSQEGKCLIHTGGKSNTNPWGGDQTAFTESMAEAGKSVSDYLGKGERIVYINVLNNISIDCDCDGNPAKPDIHDIGIVASFDPVAIDQACIDLAFAAEGSQSLQNRVNDRNGLHTLEHAQEIGLGSRTYELVDIND